MRIVGSLLALAGVALLYKNNLLLGIVAFVVGGFLAKGLFVTVKSLALVVGAYTTAYGYHSEFTPLIVVILAVCFIIVFFSRKRRVDDFAEWGFELDIGDIFDSDGDSGDGGGN